MRSYASHLSGSILCFFCGVIIATSTLAQEPDASENHAFALDVGLAAEVLGVGLINLDVGPLPDTHASGSVPYTDSDEFIGLDVSTILNILTASAGILSTDIAFDGHAGFSTSVGQVEGLGIGVSVLGLLGLDLSADSLTGIASIEGTCGNLSAQGSSELVGASLAINNAGIINLPVNPPPNTEIDVLGLLGVAGITLILNEQSVSGDGITHLHMETNALRLGINVLGLSLVSGGVTVGHAEATRNCNTADLVIDKSATPDPATVGQPLTYIVSAHNSGPETARDVLIIDQLPASVEFVSASSSHGNCSHTAGEVMCPIGHLAPGQGAEATIEVIPQQAGNIDNTAHVVTIDFDPDPDSSSIVITTRVNDPDTGPGEANLSLSKSASPTPGHVGQSLVFDFVLQNNGPDTAVGVVLTDEVPASFQIQSASASEGGTCSIASQTVTCSWSEIADGGSVSAAIVTVPQQAGTFTNNAIATSDQEDPDPPSASVTVLIEKDDTAPPNEADIALQISAAPDPVTVGTALTFDFVITNFGPADAEHVVLTDVMPSNVIIQNVTPHDGGHCTILNGAVTCEWAQLGPFEQLRATTVVVPQALGGSAPQQPYTLTSDAEVMSNTPDPDLSNNIDSVTVTVQPAAANADLSMNKSVAPAHIETGETTIFTLRIANDGPDSATAVTVTDHLPSGLLIESVTATGGAACTQSVTSAQCDWDMLAPGHDETVTMVALATAAGTYTNSATVSSDTPDPNAGNNTDAVTLTVSPPDDEDDDRPVANLVTEKRAIPERTVVGQPILFNFEVHNLGPDPANNVRLRDILPAAISILSVSADSDGRCEIEDNRIDCHWDSLQVGDRVNAVLVVTSERPGIYTNSAFAFSPDSEDDCPSCAQDDTQFEFEPEEGFSACELDQVSRNSAQTTPRHMLNAGGDLLLFTSNENPSGDNPSRHRALYTWDVLERERGERLARPHSGLELLTASRDVQRILLRSGHHPISADTTDTQVFRIDLMDDAVDSLGMLDPFGAQFASDNYGRNVATVDNDAVIVQSLGGETRTFDLPDIDTDTIDDMRLSGSARFLVFSARSAAGGLRQAYRMDTTSGELERLSDGDHSHRPSGVSSTGADVIILSDTAVAYLAEADGRLRQIGPANVDILDAAISHNGNRVIITFADQEDGGLVVNKVEVSQNDAMSTLHHFAPGSAGAIELISINQGGNVLSFNSRLDLDELNPGELPQAYLLTCFEPRHGLWGNPDRVGHGMEMNLNTQDILFNFWFSYTPDGDSTWYMIIGDLKGTSWEGTMYRALMDDDGHTEAHEIGTMWAGFDSNQTALFAWNLDGEPGFEPLEYNQFVIGPPEIDYSGSFFAPTDSGWGFSHISLREVQIATLYYYDDAGLPTWAQGVLRDDDDSYELVRLRGTNLCPSCTGPAVTEAAPAGEMWVQFAGQSDGEALIEAEAIDGARFLRDAVIKALARPAP